MGNRQCAFCQITETDPNRVLYEDDQIIIFKDRSPVADIHLQCIPKSHIKNKNYLTKSYGEIQLNTATINRNFRIKVNGIVNGVKVNKLVGVSGLLAILGGSWDKLVKFVLRAFNNLTDKCACKIYGGATVTFYAK
jgi:histidine triad (HIT) family protein